MKKILCIILLLTACLSATWASDGSQSDTSARSPFRLSLEGTLAPGLNAFSLRGMQLSVVGGMTFGKYLSASMGVGLRHIYTTVSIDRNIHGYGEADQRNYDNRLLLPLFVRIKGNIPVARFAWAGASFEPFARLDMGYAVDLQQSTKLRTSSGPFLIPAAGLDATLQSGAKWSLALGMGLYAAQYLVVNYAVDWQTVTASGNALMLNVAIGYTF